MCGGGACASLWVDEVLSRYPVAPRPIRAAVHAQVRQSSLLVASLILSFVCTGHGIPTKVQLLEAITAKRVESRLLGCAGAAAMLAAQIGLEK